MSEQFGKASFHYSVHINRNCKLKMAPFFCFLYLFLFFITNICKNLCQLFYIYLCDEIVLCNLTFEYLVSFCHRILIKKKT